MRSVIGTILVATVLLVGCGPEPRIPDQLTGIEYELDAIESELDAPAG